MAVMREFALEIPSGRIAGLRCVLRRARSLPPTRSGDEQTEDLPRVLALHGWLDNAASFVPLAAEFQRMDLDGIDLVVPDLPGHGASAHLPRGADYSFAGAMHAVLDIADALGWTRFGLLGHSMGAGIASLVAAGSPQRIERLFAIEALGALTESAENTVRRLRDAVAATRALPDKRLRVFPDLEPAVRARMQANGLSEPVARLLVERGVRAVHADHGPGGFEWSSDPRLTLPTMVRMTEQQARNLIAGIQCPTRVLYADPPQSYLPEPLRSERSALLPQGEQLVIAGSHHLHMENPRAVAAAIGDFFTG